MPKNSSGTQEDLALIRKAQRGDQDALRELLDRHKRVLRAAARRCLAQFEAAETSEDAIQEARIRIWKRIKTFDPSKATFGTWIYRITETVCCEILKRAQNDYRRDDTFWKEGPGKQQQEQDDRLPDDDPIVGDPSWDTDDDDLDVVERRLSFNYWRDNETCSDDDHLVSFEEWSPKPGTGDQRLQNPKISLSPEQKAKNKKILRRNEKWEKSFLRPAIDVSPAEKQWLERNEPRPPKLSTRAVRIRKMQMEGKTRKEIAKKEGMTVKAVATAIYMINKKFSKNL